jgi:hypothetical protein
MALKGVMRNNFWVDGEDWALAKMLDTFIV